ncbi:MAG TPA: efflux RND transporter periplasmic adaptor subunit [Armatimonadota bacterium]
MKELVKAWVLRIVTIVILVVVVRQWGVPLYHQYFTPEKAMAFMPTAEVRKGNFSVSFHEIGALQAEKSVPVMSMADGKIIKLVQDGKIVKAGDVIAELDMTSMKTQVRNAQLTYENAKSDVSKANEDLKILQASNKTSVMSAEVDLDFAKTLLKQAQEQLEKKKRLAKDKLIPSDQVIQAETDVESKILDIKKKEMALELEKKKAESQENQKRDDVRKAMSAAMIQKNAFDDVVKNLSQAIIKAPTDGLVVLEETWDSSGRRKIQEGDQARPQQTLCTLPNLSSMLIKVRVGESDAPRVHIGMPILIRLDSAPNKIYHGSVKDVANLARTAEFWEASAGRNLIDVTIAVKEKDSKILKPGMKTDVEFICKSIANAVYVPIESVIQKGGTTYVYVKRGKEFVKRMVKTGTSNDSSVCILEGLKPNEVVALRDPSRPLDQQTIGTETPADKSKPEKTAPPIPGTGGK